MQLKRIDEAAQPIDRLARLVVTPHPLTTQGQSSVAVFMAEGESLASVLYSAGVDADWVVELDGLRVPALMWQRTRVKHGVVIECRRVVHGGGNPLAQVAMIALVIYAPTLVATWGFTGVTASLVTAGVVIAGSMVINSVLPPPKMASMDMASNEVQPTYSLSGGRNGQRLWQPMALVLGQPYCVPDLAAQSYTEFVGEDQYLYQIFHGGFNLQRIETMRIGQTAIGSFEGVTKYAKGLPESSGYITGLPNSSVDTLAGGLLDAPSGTGAWVQRTTSPNTLSIGIDLEMSLFGVNSSNGAYVGKSVALEVQYAAAGSGNWVGVPTGASYQQQVVAGYDGNDDPVYTWATVYYPSGSPTYTNASTKPLRIGISFGVSSGQYDVRLRKITQNDISSSSQNTTNWTQLKSYQANPTSYPGQALVGLKIKASGQLTGSIEELNWVATARPAPYWNGSAWTTATSSGNGLSNPGTQILQLARGIYDENGRLVAGLGWADSRIDIDSIKRFMVWCAEKGFKFDAFIQDTMSHDDLLGAIAYAGLASISWDSGKLGVSFIDDDAVVEGVINMGNIKARTFSVAYATGDRADEIEYGYFDRNASNQWNSLRVAAPGATSVNSTARMSNLGITTEAHAAVLARYAMAQNVYMAKAITFEQDLEFLTYRRGAVLALSHDMTQWGYSGRVQTAVNTSGSVTLTLDDAIPAPSSGSSYIGLRLVGETQYRIFTAQPFTGSARTVTLIGAWPSGVALPGANGQPMDALWIYDFKPTPGLKVIVTKIDPSDNQNGAKVTVTPLPDEFWPYVLTGAYTSPPNRSLLSKLSNVTSAVVTETLRRQGNTFYTELTAQFEIDQNLGLTQVWGGVGGAPLQKLGSTEGRSFTWPAGLSETWNIELRPVNGLGQVGGIKRVSYAVTGLSAPPPGVTQFSINNATLNWSAVDVVDLAGYKIRFQYGQNLFWGNAAPLHEGLITEMPYDMVHRPAGVVTLLIKAVDTSGNESANPAAIVMSLGDTLVDNILLSWPQHTAWTGIKTNCSVIGGQLVAAASDFFYGSDDALFYTEETASFYAEASCAPSEYLFELTPSAAGTLKLQHEISATNYTIEYQRNNQDLFYGADLNFFYDDDSVLFYGDPTGWTIWPGGLEMTSTESIAFKISMSGGAGLDTISTLSAVLDVPDITVSLNDVSVGALGARLPLGQAVHLVKNVQVTLQSAAGNAMTAIVSDKQNPLGPYVQVFDKNLSAVTGVVDAVIQAY